MNSCQWMKSKEAWFPEGHLTWTWGWCGPCVRRWWPHSLCTPHSLEPDGRPGGTSRTEPPWSSGWWETGTHRWPLGSGDPTLHLPQDTGQSSSQWGPRVTAAGFRAAGSIKLHTWWVFQSLLGFFPLVGFTQLTSARFGFVSLCRRRSTGPVQQQEPCSMLRSHKRAKPQPS